MTIIKENSRNYFDLTTKSGLIRSNGQTQPQGVEALFEIPLCCILHVNKTLSSSEKESVGFRACIRLCLTPQFQLGVFKNPQKQAVLTLATKHQEKHNSIPHQQFCQNDPFSSVSY